jgi:nitroreductase
MVTIMPLTTSDAAFPWHADPIALPRPRDDFGVSLATALSSRRSTREFDTTRKLPKLVLAELLWCANGVNRPGTNERTVPSWRNACEIEIFVATHDAVWRYEPAANRLLAHCAGDLRTATGFQRFVATEPIELIYVASRTHLTGLSLAEQHRIASADAGFIGQNVYLYCASEGLATVFRTSFDHAPLARALRLDRTQFVTFVQSDAYPKA